MHSNLRVIDPVLTTAYITRDHGYMVYDTLLATDETFKVRPQMADWTVSGDKLTYTATVEDPDVLSKPWTTTPRQLKLSTTKADALLEAPPCVEHDAPHIVTLDHH